MNVFHFWWVVQASIALVRTQILLHVVLKFATIEIKNRCSGVLPQRSVFLSTLIEFLPCRSEMGTWFVCGSWSENACLNIPPPNAPGPTARGSAGLFREERQGSWSTATTRSLIFPPYPSRPIKPGGYKWVTSSAEKTDNCHPPHRILVLLVCNF